MGRRTGCVTGRAPRRTRYGRGLQRSEVVRGRDRFVSRKSCGYYSIGGVKGNVSTLWKIPRQRMESEISEW
jgi:hypothetical protein